MSSAADEVRRMHTQRDTHVKHLLLRHATPSPTLVEPILVATASAGVSSTGAERDSCAKRLPLIMSAPTSQAAILLMRQLKELNKNVESGFSAGLIDESNAVSGTLFRL